MGIILCFCTDTARGCAEKRRRRKSPKYWSTQRPTNNGRTTAYATKPYMFVKQTARTTNPVLLRSGRRRRRRRRRPTVRRYDDEIWRVRAWWSGGIFMCNNRDNARAGYDNVISRTFSVRRSRPRHTAIMKGSPTPAKPLRRPGGEKGRPTGAARATRSKQTTVECTT